jgi:hypothetical protein
MLTIPLRTTWVFIMFSEFRFGDPPMPEYEEPEEDGIENAGL